jgi:hypothetical protein
VWSDNDEFHHHFSASLVADSPQAVQKFIFPFYVPILETLTHQQEQYIPSEFSLENLLYANLNYTQLTNAYDSDKERSKVVLEGLDVPYLKWAPSFESRFGRHDDTSTNTMNRIYNSQHLATGPKPIENKIHTHLQHPKQSAAKTPLYNTQPLIHPSSQSTPARARPIFNKSEDNANPYSDTDSSASKKSDQSYDYSDNQLPLLLRMLVSLTDYSVENKFEVFNLFKAFCNEIQNEKSLTIQKLEGDRVYRCILSEEELREAYENEQ